MISAALLRLSKRKSRRHLYRWLADAISSHAIAESENVLNIGAGGEVSAQLLAHGIRFQSLDIDHARHPDILANIESMVSVQDESIDAIFCIEVLEHVKHPELAAAELCRVLRPGGLFVASTPFLLGIHDAPNDFYRYTRHGLRLIFADLEEVVLRERNGYFAAVAALIYRQFAHPPPLPLRLKIAAPVLLSLALVIELMDSLLPSPAGTTGYFFIFRKPWPSIGHSPEFQHD